MNRENGIYTHLDYRNAKIIHLVEQDGVERFIYKKKNITQAEADEITADYLEAREQRRMRKQKKESIV